MTQSRAAAQARRLRLPALLILFSVMLWLFPAIARVPLPETEFSGFLQTRHNIQVQAANDTLASETLARPELTCYWEGATLFASADLSENHLLGDKSGVSVHEAYLDLSFSGLTLRAGRQIIIWGQADGIRITDNISPLDISEYITRDFDEIRMGVDGLNLKAGNDMGDFQLIWLPFYRSGVLPSADSPWYLGSASRGKPVLASEEPDHLFRDSEVAARYALYLPGGDLALSYFYTWNDRPAYDPVMTDPAAGTWGFRELYHRIHVVGAEFSKPFGEFVFRAEAAWFTGCRVSSAGENQPLEKKDRIKWLGGLDWYPGGNWTLSAQFGRDRILDPDSPYGLAEPRRRDTATFSVSRDLFREKLTLSAMAYLDPDRGDSLTRVSSEYRAMDGFSVFLGTDIFLGSRSGAYGRYRDNTQVWTKLTYHF